jgi:hypothetical protein
MNVPGMIPEPDAEQFLQALTAAVAGMSQTSETRVRLAERLYLTVEEAARGRIYRPGSHPSSPADGRWQAETAEGRRPARRGRAAADGAGEALRTSAARLHRLQKLQSIDDISVKAFPLSSRLYRYLTVQLRRHSNDEIA